VERIVPAPVKPNTMSLPLSFGRANCRQIKTEESGVLIDTGRTNSGSALEQQLTAGGSRSDLNAIVDDPAAADNTVESLPRGSQPPIRGAGNHVRQACSSNGGKQHR
jgi:hypothetical protein